MNVSEILAKWRGQKCVLATMHKKETVIAPLFASQLGIDVFVPEKFDTDRFGTFTREIRRRSDQKETARLKALEAIKTSGVKLGIASEGSFGPHPSVPFVHSNLEIVVFIDLVNDLEIYGHHLTTNIYARRQEIHSADEAVEIAKAWGFPEQGIILRQSEKSPRHIYKDITTEEDLRKYTNQLLAKFFVSSIFIETDMRAHRCPKRMESIKQATIDLIKNCQSICPQCSCPGFVATSVQIGLPCSSCGLATDLAKAEVYTCQKCLHTENRPLQDKTFAKPEECPWCNP